MVKIPIAAVDTIADIPIMDGRRTALFAITPPNLGKTMNADDKVTISILEGIIQRFKNDPKGFTSKNETMKSHLLWGLDYAARELENSEK